MKKKRWGGGGGVCSVINVSLYFLFSPINFMTYWNGVKSHHVTTVLSTVIDMLMGENGERTALLTCSDSLQLLAVGQNELLETVRGKKYIYFEYHLFLFSSNKKKLIISFVRFICIKNYNYFF